MRDTFFASAPSTVGHGLAQSKPAQEPDANAAKAGDADEQEEDSGKCGSQ